MNRKTVRTLYVIALAAVAADLPVGCGGSDDSNSTGAQTSTGGYAFGAGNGGGAGVPMNNGAVSGIGMGGSNQPQTPCVASLCTPVPNGTACCVGAYGPCGAMVGNQCVGSGPGGSQGGTTGMGGRGFGGRTGRGGRNGGGFGNFGGFGMGGTPGGATGSGGAPSDTGGAPATGGDPGAGGSAPKDAGPG